MIKKYTIAAIGLIFFTIGCINQNNKSAQKVTEAKLRHVVLFKFKDSTTTQQVKEIETAFAALKTEISELVKDFEFGTNNSLEKLNQGLTHCFILTFTSETDRDAYIIHPKHVAFLDKYAKVFVDKVTVVDYWVK
jgi:uncharacterized lipoprotein NlpE involved in copper resistance